MNKFRLMRKMIYPPAIIWLVSSCASLVFCAYWLYKVCTEFIPLPPSPQLFNWIESIFSVFIFLLTTIWAICAIMVFDFWCRPVFLTENELARGFIFRKRIKKEDITGIGIAQIYGTKTAESIYNNHKYGVYICTGQCDESLIKRIGIWETLMCSELIKGLRKCRSLLKRSGTGIASFDEQAYPNTIFYLGEDLDSYAVIEAWKSKT